VGALSIAMWLAILIVLWLLGVLGGVGMR
jgi:hypothetical protein